MAGCGLPEKGRWPQAVLGYKWSSPDPHTTYSRRNWLLMTALALDLTTYGALAPG